MTLLTALYDTLSSYGWSLVFGGLFVCGCIGGLIAMFVDRRNGL